MTKKESPRSSGTCRRMSNYEIAKRNAQKQFPGYDHGEIAEKLNIPYEDGYLYLSLLDRRYRIGCRDGSVAWLDENAAYREAGFNEVMVLYDILCYSQKFAAPAGEFAPVERLSTVHNASSYAGEGAFKSVESQFDGKTELLARALKALNGTDYGKGDVSCRIPIYKSLDMVVSFWNSDEDFPAQLKFLCDKNTLQYMHYETIWYLTSYMTQRIKEIMDRCSLSPCQT